MNKMWKNDTLECEREKKPAKTKEAPRAETAETARGLRLSVQKPHGVSQQPRGTADP